MYQYARLFAGCMIECLEDDVYERKLNLRREFKTIRSMIVQSAGSFFSSLCQSLHLKSNTCTNTCAHTQRSICGKSGCQKCKSSSRPAQFESFEKRKGWKSFYSHSSSLLCGNKAVFLLASAPTPLLKK